jgi:protein translocase SecG subunit
MIQMIHIVLAVLLSLGILVQTRASGLSSTFGGSGASFQVQRRGAEKLLFSATIWVAVAFFALSIVRWYL